MKWPSEGGYIQYAHIIYLSFSETPWDTQLSTSSWLVILPLNLVKSALTPQMQQWMNTVWLVVLSHQINMSHLLKSYWLKLKYNNQLKSPTSCASILLVRILMFSLFLMVKSTFFFGKSHEIYVVLAECHYVHCLSHIFVCEMHNSW